MALLTNEEKMALRIALEKERASMEQFSVSVAEPMAGEYRRRLVIVEDLLEHVQPGARIIVSG